MLPATAAAQARAEQGQNHWVATWATAQEFYRRPPPPPPPPAAPGATSAPRPNRAPFTVNNQTVRMIVRTSIGGSRARIRLANSFGAPTVEVGAAHVALRRAGSAIVPGTDRALTFGGKPNVTLPPGAVVLSDPVSIAVPANGDLAVSLFIAGDGDRPTSHGLGLHTTYISGPGDHTGGASIPDSTTTQSYYWIAGVDVLAPADASAIVGFGDSITDGARSTADANAMWPAILAQRLGANPATSRIAVVNAGISGNQVLRDASGVSALARLDRDVFTQPGARWMILLEGINDIGNLGRAGNTLALTADQMIWAYQQIIDRAHSHGIRVAGATLTPYQGAGYYSEQGEAVREAVNNWVRTSGAFDAVIDFDRAVRDPANPKRFRADLQPGDFLHPNDTGYRLMAESIDLSIFQTPAARAPAGRR
jgi:lysophospholipase L1-like esterase